MTTLNAGSRETQILAPGTILTATASAAGAGIVRRFSAGTRDSLENRAISAGGSVRVGPYLEAAEIGVECSAGTVTWSTALPVAQEAAIQALVSEAWMSPALQALIGVHPTRIFHDDEPLLIDDEPIFHTPD